MGWSATEQVLTYPFTKLKAGSRGDLENAVSRTCTSQADLFANGTINKWAKYKPVVRPNVSYADQLDSNHQWKSTADWWKGQNGQCGLTFTTYTALGSPSSGFFAQLLAGSLSWGYTRPSGSSSQPLRAFDFIQYYAAAPKPVTGVYDNLRLYGGGKLTVQVDSTRAANDLGIQLDDLTISSSAVSGWYAGILIWKSNIQYTFAFTTTTLGNGIGNVEFTNMTSYSGSVKVVPFIASKRANQGVDPGAGIYLSCDVAPQTVSIAAEVVAVQMTIDAQWKESLHGRAGYEVNIINNTTSAVAVNNLVIKLNDGTQDIGTRSIGNVSIPAQSNQSYSGWFSVQNYDSSKTYRIVVTSSRTEVNGSAVVEEARN